MRHASPVLTHWYTCTGHAVLATRLTDTRDQLLSVPTATLDLSVIPSVRDLGIGSRLPRVRSHRGGRRKQWKICVTDGKTKRTPILSTVTPQIVSGDQPDGHHASHHSSLTSDHIGGYPPPPRVTNLAVTTPHLITQPSQVTNLAVTTLHLITQPSPVTNLAVTMPHLITHPHQ